MGPAAKSFYLAPQSLFFFCMTVLQGFSMFDPPVPPFLFSLVFLPDASILPVDLLAIFPMRPLHAATYTYAYGFSSKPFALLSYSNSFYSPFIQTVDSSQISVVLDISLTFIAALSIPLRPI